MFFYKQAWPRNAISTMANLYNSKVEILTFLPSKTTYTNEMKLKVLSIH